jgi:hypothetical protein
MAKKSYKWLSRLIDKITKSDCPNNNYFRYYGRIVTLQSGTRDYVSVNISELDSRGFSVNQIDFSFDFWTKELVFSGYNNYDERDAIINAFKGIYNDRLERVRVTDYPWEEDEKLYLPMIDNEEYDQETIMQEYKALFERKVAQL